MSGRGPRGRARPAAVAGAVLAGAVLAAAGGAVWVGRDGDVAPAAAAGAAGGGPPPNTTIAPPSPTTVTPTPPLGALPRAPGPSGELLVVAERGGRAAVEAVDPVTGAARRVAGAAGRDAFPGAVSPDGRTLAVVWTADGAGEWIDLVDLGPAAPGPPRPLVAAAGRARNPSWSPDGRWLAFESDRAGFRELWRVERDGGGLRQLTRNREGNFEPAVSPDGRAIAFVSSRDGHAQIYRVRADGGGERRLTAFHRDDWAPRWSPDGARIAFVSEREGAARLFVMRADGTGQRRLTTERGAGGAGPAREAPTEDEAAWAPDGRRIAFTRRAPGRPPRVAVADVAGGAWRELPCPTDGCAAPAWSPDGAALAVVGTRGDASDVYRLDPAGSAPAARLTRGPGAHWLPRWRLRAASPAARPATRAATR